jgi:LuxR family maltose regulon positive regulatory protein
MFLSNFEEAAGELRKAIARFEAWPPGPQRSRYMVLAYSSMGILALVSSKYTKDYNAVPWFEQAYQHYLRYPEAGSEQIIHSNLPSYVLQVGAPAKPGEIETAIQVLTAAIPYASNCLNGFLYGTDSLARAEFAYYQGDLINAEKFARQAVYQGREKKQYEVENRALFYLMRLAIHAGNITEIRELERQLAAQLEIQEYFNRYTIHDIIMGRFYTRLGLIDKIAPWLRGEVEEGELHGPFRGFDVLIKARCVYIEKDYLATLKVLKGKKTWDDPGSFLLGFLEITTLEAGSLHRLGDREGALEALKRAYNAAAPNGLIMPFIELGEHMYDLVNALLKASPEEAGQGLSRVQGIPRDWLQTIRRGASAYAKKRFLLASQYEGRDTVVAAAFSEHELTVLNSLSQGFTGEEIAENMNISVNMVKSVIRSLYTKLGAAHRADAIRIATAQGLLRDPGNES